MVIENPWPSYAWQEDPLQDLISNGFVLLKADQCMYGLGKWLDEYVKGFFKKPTGFLVPEGSSLVEKLPRICDQSHMHSHVVGGKKFTAPAGHYTEELAKAILEGALEDKIANDENIFKIMSQVSASKGTCTAVSQFHDQLASIFNLRADIVDFCVADHNTRLPTSPGQYTRRIVTAFSESNELVCFHDSWGRKANNPFLKLDCFFEDTDKILVAFVNFEDHKVKKDQLSYPAVRETMTVKHAATDQFSEIMAFPSSKSSLLLIQTLLLPLPTVVVMMRTWRRKPLLRKSSKANSR
jgi:hypothetical protein